MQIGGGLIVGGGLVAESAQVMENSRDIKDLAKEMMVKIEGEIQNDRQGACQGDGGY